MALIDGSADRRGGIALLEKHAASGDSGKAMAVLAEGYFSEGSSQQAIDMFRRAIKEDPSAGESPV